MAIDAGAAAAQSASEVTPESFQPPLQRLSGAVVFTGEPGTKAPPGSEGISVTLSGVAIEGGLPQMAAAQTAFTARLTRGAIPVSEIFEATTALEEAYANAGFVLSRVVLPQQSLRDNGTLKVTVINGYVEAIDTTNAPPEVRARIEALTGKLVGRSGLTMAELERQLLLAGDVSGVALGSALAAGNRPGGTVIALDPEFRKVTGFLGFDNFVGDDLSPPTLNAGIELNSPFSYGETIYGRLSFSPELALSSDPRYRIAALGAVVPVGTSGLSLNVEATASDTTPDTPLTPTRSNFDRQSVRLVYPYIRTRQTNVTAQFALDHQEDSQDLIAVSTRFPIYRDEASILRLGGSLSHTHDDGAFSEVGAFLSRGVDILGARTLSDVGAGTPLSRQGADAEFSKLTGSFYHQRALVENLSLSLAGRFQSAFGDPLLTAEQFSIVGARELSTFDSGELRGDSGWVVRAELATARDVTIAGRPITLSPNIFAGTGEVSLEQPSAVESAHVRAHAYGIGMDLISNTESRYRSSFMRVEFGRGERNDGGPDGERFSISGNFRF
ncbi:ShlB/FhaC/HecB family hemolysin secretion/activation protein [Defluviimonas sp. WL0024]|uniref:ShlB/FhaC/HecB family hemolysin secretion/activation protein n=1 Tax=Albidovulum salinarum TaxID=2984153 RepID=A0ABT2X7D6_9RHOB|nr:ShlB/FhaC/HecB family hemolysin secretion/activation protein [Defluviimonas sp. WL0024]MCU9849866.1 ShlB/FhaC/HecB family hemolysin secretion/activation protein [Defluviimonas sp. WL0024]